MEFIYLLIGLITGFTVGLTGMGGGALVSPALIFLGLPTRVAIGTDIVYAAITRLSSSFFHFRKGNVNTELTKLLLSGSIPGVVTGALFFRFLADIKSEQTLNSMISIFLGIVLVLIATGILLRISKIEKDGRFIMPEYWKLILAGFIVGIVVQFTSVGSGTLLALFLIVFTELSPRKIVGTDNFHGFVLTSMAGLAHSILGNVDHITVLLLASGSIPGTYLGSYFVSRIDARPLKIILAVLILVSGIVILGQTLK